MNTNSNQNNTFQINLIIRWSWTLLSKNIRSWCLLAIIVHFLCFCFMSVFELFSKYLMSMFKLNIHDFEMIETILEMLGSLTFFNISFSATFLNKHFTAGFGFYQIFVYLTYFIMLQITVNQVIHLYVARNSKNLTSDQVITILSKFNTYFFSPTIFFRKNIAHQLLRVTGILLSFFLVFAVFMQVGLFFLSFSFSKSYFSSLIFRIMAFVIVGNLIFLIITYFVSRCSLAIAASINEDKGVFNSFSRSWNMTQSCSIKILALFYVAFLAAGILLYCFTIPIMVLGNSNIFAVVIWAVGLILSPLIPTILMSVCYYALHLSGKV